MKRFLVLGLVMAGCLLAVIGGRMYYTHRNRPIQVVQPIVRLLDEGGLGSVERGTFLIRGLMWRRYPDGTRGMERDPNRIKITGAGALEVKRALLRAMGKATDPATLNRLLICLMDAEEEGNIVFQGEEEWTIIGAAAERQNADPMKFLRYFVTKDTNGVTVLDAGGAVSIL